MEIYAGVPEERIPVLVDLAALGGSANVLRQLGYPGGTPNVRAGAYSSQPADPGGRGTDPRAHFAARLYTDSIPHLHPLSHLHSLPNLHTLPDSGPD